MSEAMWLAFKNIAILKFGSIGAGGDSMIGISETVPIPAEQALGRERFASLVLARDAEKTQRPLLHCGKCVRAIHI